jgi:hypothetical protein
LEYYINGWEDIVDPYKCSKKQLKGVPSNTENIQKKLPMFINAWE